MEPDKNQEPTRASRRGIPWWLLILLVLVAFVGNLVFSCYSARNRGLEATERLYNALRFSDDAVVKSAATGHALEQLSELETKFGRVQSYEVTRVNALPADHWIVHLRVIRDRARTVEEVTNMNSGSTIRHVGGALDSE